MFEPLRGLSVLKNSTQFSGKTLYQKMMAVMSPRSTTHSPARITGRRDSPRRADAVYIDAIRSDHPVDVNQTAVGA